MDKVALRKQLRKLYRTELTDEMRQRGSSSVVEQLLQHPLWESSRHVALYMALPDEPALDVLIRQAGERKIYLPRVLSDEAMSFFRLDWESQLERSGSFGIWEPQADEALEVSPRELDLIVIPALAYDARGYRLGRGKGYYDRYLKDCPARRLGVTYALEAIESLPVDPWDLPVEEVISPNPPLR